MGYMGYSFTYDIVGKRMLVMSASFPSGPSPTYEHKNMAKPEHVGCYSV